LFALNRNPLECWATEHFERPIVAGGLPIGHLLLVHEPTAIRRVLLDNAANYLKDRLQRRVLSAGLDEGLLGAEGAQWRLQRRIIATMVARNTVMDFTPAMMGAADVLIKRWSGVGTTGQSMSRPRCQGSRWMWSNARSSRVGLDPTPKTSVPPW
jgi:cytochrome P450